MNINNDIAFEIFDCLHGHEFDFIKDALSMLEKCLSSKSKQWDNEINALTKLKGKDYASEYVEFISEDIWRMDDGFPILLRNSFYISLFSYFEITLKELCILIDKYYNLNEINNNPKKFKYIHNYIDYLEKFNEFDRISSLPEWNVINIIKEIRNSLAHHNGNIKYNKSYAEIKDFINNNSYEFGQNDELLIISNDFIIFTINTFKNYFSKIFDSFNSSIQK